MVVRVEVRRQRNHDGATETAVDVIGDNTLQHCAFKDPIQAAASTLSRLYEPVSCVFTLYDELLRLCHLRLNKGPLSIAFPLTRLLGLVFLP